ncbi:MAG: rRNA methyltransferase [Planctomycetaceae bacterium]|nr:rRNA methyltransferase [Planctomycetaceae bacterium]
MPQHITSRHNPRVKAAAKLRTGRKRTSAERFLIDGPREIARAIAAGVEIAEAFVCDELVDGDEAAAAVTALRSATGEFATVTPEVFEKLCFGQRGSGAVAVAVPPARSLAGLQLPPAPLVAVIEGVEKPGNVGAVLRSADGAGVDAVVVADPRTDLFNPQTIRASLGTVFGRHVCTASAADALAWLRTLNVPLLAARPDATVLYTAVDYRRGAAIILGSEATGLTDLWHAADVTPVKLPMRGLADSLNVSATAAVMFYEAERQRAAHGQ